jgi:serine/threonine-protein kinase
MGEEMVRAAAEQRVGRVIAGKYRVDQVLGVGGMATVYAVTHERNNAKLAIKMLHPELSIREDIRQRFLREGYAANTVGHPGVVMVVDDAVAEDGAAFIVMERLQGASAEELQEQRGGRLPIRAAIAIVDQMLDVLRAAHEKGIVHRDVKPANTFVTRDGTVKLLDFGIARVRDALTSGSGQGTGSGIVMGTPAFMPPEQALAKSSEIDSKTDLWACGATLFTLVSGKFVHMAENGAQMMVKAATQPAPSLDSVTPDVPRPIVEVVAKALAFERRDRWESASAMRDALRAAHARAYAGAPNRDAIVALFDPTANQPSDSQVVASTIPLVNVQKPLTGNTTAQPVSSEPVPELPRSRAPQVVGAVVVAAFAASIAIYAMSTRVKPVSAVVEPAAIVSSAPPVPVESRTEMTPVMAASSAPVATQAPVASDVAKPTVHAHKPIAPSVSSASCNPAYYTDAQGHRKYKPECL